MDENDGHIVVFHMAAHNNQQEGPDHEDNLKK